MAIKRTKINLDKKDYLRALLSDTLPFDTPIIFSNDGFYINAKKYEKYDSINTCAIIDIYKKIINPLKDNPPDKSKKKKKSAPYKYKIIKDSYNFRELSLIHPRAQINYSEFYNSFSSVIIHCISNSPFSIRRPVKVSSSFYLKERCEDGKYKKSNITTTNKELSQKYSSSYYAYSGYNRLYKYFNSLEFYNNETKFSTMWTLDVSHCFDSIYTHSVSWAIKEKNYVREHLEYNSQFPQELDTLMQRSNNNETNGIPIGSEFSRIFSELIFQRIDLDIENKIKNKFSWSNNIDYKILRYVDDYVLYTHNEEQALEITKIISLNLNNYNLHLNNQKLIKLQRPFCTKKTSMISRVDDVILWLESGMLVERNERIQLLDTKNKNNIYKEFINKTKSICFENNSTYADISSYIISALCKILEKIFNYFSLNKIKLANDDLLAVKIKDAIFIMVDLMVFYYSVYPYISSSYKVAKMVILTDNYLENVSQDYQNIFRTKITHAAENLYVQSPSINHGKLEIEPIEKLNFIISTTFFGDNYLIGVDAFNEILKNKTPDYFTIISCLFYFRERHCYQQIKTSLEKIIKKMLMKPDLLQDSQLAHLFLDVLSCPFVTLKTRSEIYQAFLRKYYPKNNKEYINILKDLDSFQSNYWFVNWKNHDLLAIIEKKELKVTY